MDIKGLDNLIDSMEYRSALGLPDERKEKYELLAMGEYNINYLFIHPVSGKKLILRVNCGSQMHLQNQIEYEAEALKLLKASHRTPELYYVDGTMKYTDHGILVMEYLPGHHMIYENELFKAADILADIHSIKVPSDTVLIKPDNPLQAILSECEEMFIVYSGSDVKDFNIELRIRKLLDKGWDMITDTANKNIYSCIINTELNSTNFLINDSGLSYLCDWEKPIISDPAQDLGHFLAPTTTFWKTDYILTKEEINSFIDAYISSVAGRFDVTGLKERILTYITITCLRGLTWCAMAYVEYKNPDKLIKNESTEKKLDAYLSDELISKIEEIFNQQ